MKFSVQSSICVRHDYYDDCFPRVVSDGFSFMEGRAEAQPGSLREGRGWGQTPSYLLLPGRPSVSTQTQTLTPIHALQLRPGCLFS